METRSAGGRTALAAAAAVATAAALPADDAGAQERPELRELPEVVRAVEGIDAMRSTLAKSFSREGVEADRETFRQVCRPVGKKAGKVATENGWVVQQLSEKYRNPDHAPDAGAVEVLRRMEEDEGLTAVTRRTSLRGQEGVRYFRRIVVEPACLACHGARDERPAFVRESYPRDRAFGFEPGDLRGVYAVFVPDSVRDGGGDGR